MRPFAVFSWTTTEAKPDAKSCSTLTVLGAPLFISLSDLESKPSLLLPSNSSKEDNLASTSISQSSPLSHVSCVHPLPLASPPPSSPSSFCPGPGESNLMQHDPSTGACYTSAQGLAYELNPIHSLAQSKKYGDIKAVL